MNLPPPPEILMTEVAIRDEDTLKWGEANEALVLLTFDVNHPESYVKI